MNERGYHRRVGRTARHCRVRPIAARKGHTLIVIARPTRTEHHRHRLALTGSQIVTATRNHAEGRSHIRRSAQGPVPHVRHRKTVRLARPT